MTSIHFDIPESLGRLLGEGIVKLSLAAKEAFLADLYRNRRITLHQLAQALELGRIDVEGVLKRHEVTLDYSRDDLDAEADLLRRKRD